MSKRAHNGKTYDTCGGCGTMTTESETHDCETGEIVVLATGQIIPNERRASMSAGSHGR